MREVLK